MATAAVPPMSWRMRMRGIIDAKPPPSTRHRLDPTRRAGESGEDHRSRVLHSRNADRAAATDAAFSALCEETNRTLEAACPSLGGIPPFHRRRPTSKDPALVSLRREARTRFLSRKSSETLSGEDLDNLWQLLSEHATGPRCDEGLRIDWDGLCTVRDAFAAMNPGNRNSDNAGDDDDDDDNNNNNNNNNNDSNNNDNNNNNSDDRNNESCGGEDDGNGGSGGARTAKEQRLTRPAPRGARYFDPAHFCKFPSDARGRIAIYDLFQYVMRQVSLRQIRMGFCYYDSAGYGYLREEDLENYIFEQIPTLQQLSSLGTEFHPFYVCTAVRKFFFFLDPGRRGKIGIRQLITSPILAELFELRGETFSEDNWFSAPSAQRVYGQYLNLDRDRNGMLSRSEMARYGEGTLTDVFLDRLFETQHTYGGEIDFKSYLDFALAMDHKRTPQGLAYFWRILDVQHRGFLTSFDLNVFFREVQRKLAEAGHEVVDFADVRDEIFDMIHPADPHCLTLADLLKSGTGDTVVSILTDVKGFWLYDHRESL